MARSRIVAELDFAQEGKHSGFLRLPHSVHRSAYGWIPIPITCIKNGAGPSVLLVAGNHGDEYEGQVALIKLTQRLAAAEVSGRIIILSAANFPAAMAGQRTSPIDAGNLNRSFPGDPDGTPTAMMADYIETVLLPSADYVFDLHSGGSSLCYVPSSLVRRSPEAERAARLLELTRVFGAPVGLVVDNPHGGDRTLSGAAERVGTLHLGTELGGGGTVSPAALAIAERGLACLLHHIGALRRPLHDEPAHAEPGPPTRLLAVRGRDYYCYAADGGLFEPYVELGDAVAAGQAAGATHFPDTPWRPPTIAYFERAGIVVCKRIPGRAERGDCLYHLGSDDVAA
jgi:predicted deacylase